MPEIYSASLHDCADRVRSQDPDRFYATLFAPRKKRPGIFAILAFDLELREISGKVTTEMLGEMRYQWWADLLTELRRGEPARAHPVVQALAGAGFSGEVWDVLAQMVVAYRATLYDPRFEDHSLWAIAQHCGVAGELSQSDVRYYAERLPHARADLPDPLTAPSVRLPRSIQPYQTLVQLYEAQEKREGASTKLLPPYWLAVVWGRQLFR